jgi:hypothetical protein
VKVFAKAENFSRAIVSRSAPPRARSSVRWKYRAACMASFIFPVGPVCSVSQVLRSRCFGAIEGDRCLANERDSAPRIVERDVVADLLQVNFGLWCEVRAHIHFARSLAILVYLRSRRSSTSAAGFGLPLRRPLSIADCVRAINLVVYVSGNVPGREPEQLLRTAAREFKRRQPRGPVEP